MVSFCKEEILSANDYQNYIFVSDGVLFIQQLAHWQRSKVQIPVIAVTGSTGKTSTKDFLHLPGKHSPMSLQYF